MVTRAFPVVAVTPVGAGSLQPARDIRVTPHRVISPKRELILIPPLTGFCFRPGLATIFCKPTFDAAANTSSTHNSPDLSMLISSHRLGRMPVCPKFNSKYLLHV